MSHKLTNKEWKEIKELLKKSNSNVVQIAKQYKIARNSIYSKFRNNKWKINSKIKNRYNKSSSIKNKYNRPSSYLRKFLPKDFIKACYFCNKNIILCVHHKNQNKEDNSLDNLVILCWKCHKRLHKLLPNKKEYNYNQSLIKINNDIIVDRKV
jgi:hypothetical protein